MVHVGGIDLWAWALVRNAGVRRASVSFDPVDELVLLRPRTRCGEVSRMKVVASYK